MRVLQRQLEHLGRSNGNPVLGVFQKYLTGHPKGAAGAWMLNGGLQILQTGLVPGNRNADNVDAYLEQFDHIAFINKPIQTRGVKAFSVFSFGFGQKGAQAVTVHAKYVLATLGMMNIKPTRESCKETASSIGCVQQRTHIKSNFCCKG